MMLLSLQYRISFHMYILHNLLPCCQIVEMYHILQFFKSTIPCAGDDCTEIVLNRTAFLFIWNRKKIIYFLLFSDNLLGLCSLNVGKKLVSEINSTYDSTSEDRSRMPVGNLMVFIQVLPERTPRFVSPEMSTDRAFINSAESIIYIVYRQFALSFM